MRRILFVSTLLCLLLLRSTASRANDFDEELLRLDRELLQKEGIGHDGPSLLAFFKKRTLAKSDYPKVRNLIAQLGSDEFTEREGASRALRDFGSCIRPLLRDALQTPDAEVIRRVNACLDYFERGPGPALPIAATRILAAENPEGTVDVLLEYLPFAEDRYVQEVVLDALVKTTPTPKAVKPRLRNALVDETAWRRAAAAYVLGRLDDPQLQAGTRKLFADPEALVRLRAVQGRLFARDRDAVPVLIDLVTAPLGDYRYDVEDLLYRLGGDRSPVTPGGDGEDVLVQKRETWAKWWEDKGETIDLAHLSTTPKELGFTLVPEMHANRVWECDRQGKKRWEVIVDGCPIDAQVIGSDRILVAELNANRVTERDRSGKVLWEFAVGTPIACQRLNNGNTWISTNHRFFVVDPSKKEISSVAPENAFFIHSVQRLRNGNVICVSMAGEIREYTSSGKILYKVPLNIQGGWSGIESVKRGRYLVSNSSSGVVQEVDTTGKVHWEYKWSGSCYASRLSNGQTLVVSNSWGIRVVDRNQKTLWEQKIGTSLWRSHRR